MQEISEIPTSDELSEELRRKMLVLLASIFFCVGLIYVTWVLSLSEIATVPVGTGSLTLVSLAVLLLARKSSRHRLLLDLLCVVVFCVFSYTSLHQVGLRSSSVWWLVIPIICAALTRSFIVAGVLGIAHLTLLGMLYTKGAASWGTKSLVSPVMPEEQLLLAIVLSQGSVLVFVALSVHWSRRMVDNLSRARQLTEEALRAKALFLARISHEIRTPLNGMIGATELMQSSSTPDSQRRQLMAVQDHSAKMLLALVNDILDFSKLEAQKFTTDVSPVRVRRVVFQTAELFSVQAFDKGIELTFSRGPQVPRTVMTDETRLRQIVSNLVSNAIKFTSKGGVHVHMDYRGTPEAGDLIIEVSDTGAGISKERIPNLFSAYEQSDSSVARVYGGTGLGLSICDALAKLMGGRVEVVSTLGEGSAFSLVVPIKIAPDNRPPVRRVEAGVRALVATASKGMRRHMQSILEDLGVGIVHIDTMPSIDSVIHARADIVMVDSPLLRNATDAKVKLDELASEGVRVALLSPLGSDVMIGAAVGTTILYKPVRRSNARDFIEDAGTVAHVVPSQPGALSSPPAPLKEHAPAVPAKMWLNVLVADDNPTNQVVTQAMLSNMNCASVLVSNGAEALVALENQQFDLVLMDLQMPELDGLAATKELRRREAALNRTRIPVVALTGNNETSDLASCLEAGMDRFLSKPFGLAQLRHVMEAVTTGTTATDGRPPA